MEKDNGKLIEEIELLQKRIAELATAKTERDKIERIATEAKELSDNIQDTVLDPLIVMGTRLNILSVNRAFYDTFKTTPEETLGKFIYDLGDRQWDLPKLRELLENILPNNASFENYIIEHNFPDIGKRVMVLNGRRIPRPPEAPRIILLAIRDITDIASLGTDFEKAVTNSRECNVIDLKKEVNVLLKRLKETVKYSV